MGRFGAGMIARRATDRIAGTARVDDDVGCAVRDFHVSQVRVRVARSISAVRPRIHEAPPRVRVLALSPYEIACDRERARVMLRGRFSSSRRDRTEAASAA